MADVIFVAVLVAFFGLAVLLVKACERIIGADALTVVESDEIASEPDEVAV